MTKKVLVLGAGGGSPRWVIEMLELALYRALSNLPQPESTHDFF